MPVAVSASEAEEMRLAYEHPARHSDLPRNYLAAKAALAECVRVDQCSTMEILVQDEHEERIREDLCSADTADAKLDSDSDETPAPEPAGSHP